MSTAVQLQKAPSGVQGLDEITAGGLPRGRPTLVCGSSGCGKTMLGLQFLVHGALVEDEPGVFVAFEETVEDLAVNVASFGWDLAQLRADGHLRVEHIRIDPGHIQEAGAYDLEGLFIRLGAAIDSIGATRVVIDTLEVLFASLDQQILRAELQRLFRWLKDRGVTALITAERGDGVLTRHGLEEYVSDCVILLDHRVVDQVSTRHLRVVKYRGSAHSTDETPFMIDEHGFRVMPLGSMRLDHPVSEDVVSSGVARIDAMLGGRGYYRGSSTLISGSPGSGKTTLAASFLRAGCERGERGVFFAYEESPDQLMRNLKSVGIDLRPHVEAGLLRIVSVRPSSHGLEMHLSAVMHEVEDFDPALVVVDPLSAFGASSLDRYAMLLRLIDWLKVRQVTAVCTTLTSGQAADITEIQVSSVIDAWLSVSSIEHNGERNRSLRVIKARGTAHSNQVREMLISSSGIDLVDVYVGTSGGVVLGTERQLREAADAQLAEDRAERTAAHEREIERRRAEVEASIVALRAKLEADVDELQRQVRADSRAAGLRADTEDALRSARGGDQAQAR